MHKAYRIGESYGTSSLHVVQTESPPLLSSEILLDVKAVSLNYRDTLVVNGIWRPPVGRIPVSDGVGIVLQVGSDVTNVKVGDRVAGIFFPNWISGRVSPDKLKGSLGGSLRDGMMQQRMVLQETEVIHVPEYLTHEEAATLPCAAVAAWHALVDEGKIKAGDTVLIEGTGSVSLFSLQFALMLGAVPIVLSSSDDKLDKIKKFGVKHLINYQKHWAWENQVLSITNGSGVDHIVEVVGAGHINKSIQAVAMGGTISVLGLMGGVKGEINTEAIMEKNIRLQGIVVGSKEMFHNMNSALQASRLHPIIDRIFSFDETRDAFVYLEKSKHFGKICIKL